MKIYLIGFMGSGKTYWGKQLSNKLNIPFFDLDDQIAEDTGKGINQIFDENGEEYFRMREKEILHLLSESHASFVMACGGGTPCFFNNIDFLKKQGKVIWISCSTEIIYNRLIEEKEKRPLIKKINNKELKSFITKKYSARKIYYRQANIVLDDEGLTIDKIFNSVVQN
jgi:shikimate kinase